MALWGCACYQKGTGNEQCGDHGFYHQSGRRRFPDGTGRQAHDRDATGVIRKANSLISILLHLFGIV